MLVVEKVALLLSVAHLRSMGCPPSVTLIVGGSMVSLKLSRSVDPGSISVPSASGGSEAPGPVIETIRGTMSVVKLHVLP